MTHTNASPPAVDNRRMYLFLLVLTIAAAVGLQGWRTLINNFAVEKAGINGLQMGAIQSVREIPGFLSLLVIYLLLVIKEHRLAALSIAICGLGVVLTGWLPSFYGLIFTTLVMSFGFHYFETLNMSLTLQYFDVQKAPVVAGRLRGISSAANLAVGGLVFIMATFMGYTGMYTVLGVLVLLAGLWLLFWDPSDRNIAPQHRKMILRKRYWLFYALSMCAGARRQVFVAFAVFLLVERFEYSVQAITLLFVVNNIINYFLSPMIGKAINRFGERAMLTLEYTSLIAIFLAYAYTESRWFVAVLYILDHIFFNFAIAVRTYFQKIADPSDIAPSMAVGFTINHIMAVVIPVTGGVLWLIDYKYVFIGGAALAATSLLLSQFVRTPTPSGG